MVHIISDAIIVVRHQIGIFQIWMTDPMSLHPLLVILTTISTYEPPYAILSDNTYDSKVTCPYIKSPS